MFTLNEVERIDANETAEHYTADFTVTLAGDGLWGAEAGRVVRVTGATVVRENDAVLHVSVTHNSTWDIYTDTAFEAAISNALGFAVVFTEQGMQDNCYASMEC